MDTSRNGKLEQTETGRSSEQQPPAMENQQPDADLVAQRAYERYQERGREDGHDMDDWLEAEREVRARQQSNSGVST